jgi:Domain of unknown function (DUF4397)
MKVFASTRRKAVLLAIPGLILGLVLGTAWAVPASASSSARTSAGYGWVRLAHLSPNTPAVDVYLYSFGNPSALLVLKHVAYGTVSSYERVAAGDYSVAMRGAGSAPSSAPVLSTGVWVDPGGVYTVAGLGPASGLRLAVLTDRLTTPPEDSLVRVIQASLRQHMVDVSCGTHTLANGLAFGSVSSYQAVPAGSASVRVTAPGGDASGTYTFAAATAHTIVVMDGPTGLQIVTLEDAAGSASMPRGGVATGYGGTAPGGSPSPLPWVGVLAAGSLLALAGGFRLRAPGRQRRQAIAGQRTGEPAQTRR